MVKNKKVYIWVLGVIFSLAKSPVSGQESFSTSTEEHDHNGIEIGLGVGGTYLFQEKEYAPGGHLHAMYNHHNFSYGLGLESIFAEVKHYGVGGIVAYRPIEDLEVSVSPGILLKNSETGKHLFAMHFEVSYFWEFDHFGHMGPVVGYGFAGEDQHLFLGLHLGVNLNN